MGKFSGYLICSDYDGTFATGGTPVPENVEAVRYFIDNGGYFTLATGRTVKFIREKGLQSLINAPACLCNGSVIYDYCEGRPLHCWNLSFTVAEFLQCIASATDLMTSIYVFETAEESFSYEDLSVACGEKGTVKALKLLCKFATAEDADEFRAFAQTQPLLQGSYISKSCSLGVEFNPKEGTKGTALEYIKNYLGDIHTTVGVGNYENDLPLLEHADIAATPASGLQLLQKEADILLPICKEGAVRSLIEHLDHKNQKDEEC